MENNNYKTIDEYIAQYPVEVRNTLQELRIVIHKAAPEAVEKISYQMPAFSQEGVLVYFAAFKNHIGFYPAPRGIDAFKEELSVYEGSKGTVRFPIGKPLPYELITRIVKFRVAENLEKAKNKSPKKK